MLKLALASLGAARLGMGPILFGEFTAAWDMLFIRIKHTARKVPADARRAAGKGE
ncbi:MAG: hypothetical protein Q4E45_11030 [Eubacteriales bacterium]|nr:hypothetical protein [Eubacteriales bacterium]